MTTADDKKAKLFTEAPDLILSGDKLRINYQAWWSKLAAPFKSEFIEWRISQTGVKKDGVVWAMCLAYVDNRAVVDRLDEVCGPGNWKDEFYIIKLGEKEGQVGFMCGISLRINDEWVTKWDGAQSTDIEKIKGGISGAEKRAAVKWGIGRYLYGLEATFANVSMTKVTGARWAKTKDGKPFWWTPPELPAWALPKEQVKKQ